MVLRSLLILIYKFLNLTAALYHKSKASPGIILMGLKDKESEFDIIIDPDHIQKEYIRDLYRYRELFYFFAWRDMVVRYKQTFLGVLWAIIRPILNMAVFVFVFGKIAKLDSSAISYPLFVFSGLLPWQLFTASLIDSSNSLIQSAPVISKVYFPRVILPFTCIVTNFADFLISLCLFLVLMPLLGSFEHSSFLLMPLFIIQAVLLCLGTSLWISALTVRFRDLRFLVPFIVQFGIFISPIGYSSFLVPGIWFWLYLLNPMVGIIEGFRWCCFGIYHPDLPAAMIISLLINSALLISGFRYFRKMENIFADIL